MKKGQEKESSSGQRNFGARLKNFCLPNFEGNMVLFWLIEKGVKLLRGAQKIYVNWVRTQGAGGGHFSFMVSYPGAQARGSGGVGGGDWRLTGTGH